MLTFNEETHKYFWDGKSMPGVSEFLESSGLKKVGYYPPGAAQRGREIHTLTELFDRGLMTLEEMKDEPYLPYVQAWVQFRHDFGFIPSGIEMKIGNPELWLAGTVDRVGKTTHVPEIELDIKSGAKEPWHGLQLACYNLIRESRALRFTVYIGKDRKYIIQPWTDDNDYVRVLQALELKKSEVLQ